LAGSEIPGEAQDFRNRLVPASRQVHRLFGPIAIRSDICTKLLVTFCECFRRSLIARRVGMTVLFVQ